MKTAAESSFRTVTLAMVKGSIVVAAVAGQAGIAGAAYRIPESRSVIWEGRVGVPGDIPSRTWICETLQPSGGDDTLRLQEAIRRCPAGDVLRLGPGTFRVSRPITMKAGITLRGSGMDATTLQGARGMTGSYLIGLRDGHASFDLGNARHLELIGGLEKGSDTISTASPHGWRPGDYVVIDQLNDPRSDPPVSSSGTAGNCTWCGRERGARSLGQMVKIVSVPSATTIKVEIPLYWSYRKELRPQGTVVKGVVAETGIEDLTVDNTLSGNASQADNGTIFMNEAVSSWLLRVQAIGSYRNMVRIYGGYRNTIRGCRFHEGVPALPANGGQYDTSRAYGINLSQWSSAMLIENNEFYHLAMSVILDGPVSGNVIAYNYFHDNYNSVSWQQDAIAHHGAHPMMNLYEGNLASGLSMSADNIWGTSSDNTFFRNRITNSPSFTSRTWAIDLYQGVRYYNLVGNVIGDTSDSIYELANTPFSTSRARAIYKTGYVSGGDSSGTGGDRLVQQTLIRHGNWDSVSKSVQWHDRDDRALPPSLYLEKKPLWWGKVNWPAIGPDVSPMYPAAAAVGTPWGASSR
jgi:hypothetical protein